MRVNNGFAPVYETNDRNLQPRLGFAWDPTGSGKTSLRGAYAVLVDQPVTNLVTPLAGNPPFANPVALPAGRTTTLATAINDALASGSLSPNAVEPGFDNAYVQSWNLNLRTEAAPASVYSRLLRLEGTHLRITRNINHSWAAVRPFAALSSGSPCCREPPPQHHGARGHG